MKKEDLIEGKWYKNLHSDQSYISKYNKVRKESKYFETKDGYIHTKGGINYTSHTGAVVEDISFAEECSINEILQYLPKNHPDYIKYTQLQKFFI